MDAAVSGDRKIMLHFGGLVAAHFIPASRGIRCDGPSALATIPEKPSPDSEGPDSCADDSSYSSGCPELRYDEYPDGPAYPDGPGYFTRGDFLEYYGEIDGAARWASMGPISSTPDMDVSAWPAKFRTGFVKCSARTLMGVLRSLNYRSRPRHSLRLVPREDFMY